MLFIVIGLFVAVAVGAFLRQQSRTTQVQEEQAAPEPEQPLDLPDEDEDSQQEIILTARPVTSPEIASGATYSVHAPAGEESPYGRSSEPRQKPQAQSNLLRWCGRTGNIQLDNMTVPGPVAYWANGDPATPEPSCIDITLPVAFPQSGGELPADGAESYAGMSDIQRGIYLTWLAGARIQPPIHACYPAIWLYGIERRTIVDKLDLTMCISEAFRLLPLLRWEALSTNLINFITWLAVKVWLPDEDLLGFCRRMNNVPEGLLDILLNSYANSMLPLPSAVAFTVIRTCERLRRKEQPVITHSEQALQKFTPIYKELCKGGLVLMKPQEMLKISYKPSNPSITLDKKDSDTVEIPDFFSNLQVFKPLLDSWEVFLLANKPEEKAPDLADIAERPDFEGFVKTLRPENSDLPLLATLENIGKLMKFSTDPGIKLNGKERKAIVDTAQVEGWQIVPDLGISGREYNWKDRILLLELAPGTLLPQGYRVASFLLEFLCASLAVDEDRVFEPLRQRMNDCFALTEDDNIRLEGQKPLVPTQYGPEYYGDFLCAWLSEDERKAVRNFILEAVSFMPEFGNNPEVNSILCEVLKLKEDEAIPEQEARKTLREKGKDAMRVLVPLFKNN